MAIDKRAGQPAQQSDLINVAQLTAQYYVLKPEVGNAEHAVKFGTSGHRGSAARHNFNEPHIWPSPGPLRKIVRKTGSPVRAMSAKIPTPSPSRRLFRCWKC